MRYSYLDGTRFGRYISGGPVAPADLFNRRVYDYLARYAPEEPVHSRIRIQSVEDPDSGIPITLC
jgi:hypothetical protein